MYCTQLFRQMIWAGLVPSARGRDRTGLACVRGARWNTEGWLVAVVVTVTPVCVQDTGSLATVRGPVHVCYVTLGPHLPLPRPRTQHPRSCCSCTGERLRDIRHCRQRGSVTHCPGTCNEENHCLGWWWMQHWYYWTMYVMYSKYQKFVVYFSF